MSLQILRLPDVQRALGTRKSSIYASVQRGEITAPVKIAVRASGWPRHEIEEIIAARIRGDDGHAIRRLVQRLHAERAEARATS